MEREEKGARRKEGEGAQEDGEYGEQYVRPFEAGEGEGAKPLRSTLPVHVWTELSGKLGLLHGYIRGPEAVYLNNHRIR